MNLNIFIKSGVSKSACLLFVISVCFLIQAKGQEKSQAEVPLDCSCFRLNVSGFYAQTSNGSFAVDAPNSIGGKLYIHEKTGFVGLGLPITSSSGAPYPLQRFHLMGNSILGGGVLVSSDIALQKRWVDRNSGNDPTWGLWIDKGVIAANYAVTSSNYWPDYVFDENYTLRPLSEVEKFIKKNKHLPEIPSAKTIKDEGYTLLDMNTSFMQKIEELTLYAIDQEKQIKQLEEQLKRQEQLVNELMTRVKRKK